MATRGHGVYKLYQCSQITRKGLPTECSKLQPHSVWHLERGGHTRPPSWRLQGTFAPNTAQHPVSQAHREAPHRRRAYSLEEHCKHISARH